MITGSMFRDGVISASNNIANNRQAVDALNIFPVPDGDTGTNMSMTIGAAAKEMAVLGDDCTVEEASSRCASALLRGARGNSGVILSLIFRGFSKALKGMDTADGKAVANAFRKGVDAAYKAVMKPKEGTMLTVKRLENPQKAAVKPLTYAKPLWTQPKKRLQKLLNSCPFLRKPVLLTQAVRALCLFSRAWARLSKKA